MSNRVLGFQREDAVAGIWWDVETEKRFICIELERDEEGRRNIRKVELLPVVSLSALKKWCKENQFSNGQVTDLILGKCLIDWAEKESVRGVGK